MRSYFMDKNKKIEVFVGQEVEGMFRIARKDMQTGKTKGVCRRGFRTIKRAQDRLDEIAQVLGWETAHYTYE